MWREKSLKNELPRALQKAAGRRRAVAKRRA
jgi:hypothetical protein